MSSRCLSRHPAVAYLFLVRPMKPTSRRTLTIRLLTLELGPLVGALVYSYYHPRLVVVALCVYSLIALGNVCYSIRDGVVLEWFGRVCERKEEKIGFWVCVFIQASFPLLFLSVAIGAAATKTLVWPPR
jgi:hypothetical protein